MVGKSKQPECFKLCAGNIPPMVYLHQANAWYDKEENHLDNHSAMALALKSAWKCTLVTSFRALCFSNLLTRE
jgi:hypothetical protein